MKKLFYSLLTVLVLGALGFGAYRYFCKVPVYHGEDLAPSKTLLYFGMPNISDSRRRFSETGLSKILNEPSVNKLVKSLYQHSEKLPEGKREWFQIYQQFSKLLAYAEGEVFWAVSDLSISPDISVAGMLGWDSGSRRKEVGKALDELVSKLRVEFPESQLSKKEFEKVHYQLWSYKKVQIAYGRLGNMDLITYGEGNFQNAISRTRNPDDSSFKNTNGFKKMESRRGEQDFYFLANPEPLKGFFAMLQTLGKGGDFKFPYEELFYSVNFKQKNIEERGWFSLSPEGRKEQGLPDSMICPRNTLKAAGKDTLLYSATWFDLSRYIHQVIKQTSNLKSQGPLKQIESINSLLETYGIHIQKDFIDQIGMEWGLALEWEDAKMFPGLNLILETKDPEPVRVTLEKVLEVVASFAGPQLSLEKIPGPGGASMTIFHSSEGRVSLSPAYSVFDRYLFISSSQESLENALKNFNGQGERLADQEGFKKLNAPWEKESYQFAYIDQKRLFDRTYNLVNGFSVLAKPFLSKSKWNVDFSQFPPPEAITRHLSAGYGVGRIIPEGVETVSEGPTSLVVLGMDLLFPEMLELKKQ